MKKFLLLLIIAILVTGASALEQSRLDELKSEYNSQTEKVPDFLGNVVGGETINVEINRSGNMETLGVKMEGIRIEEIKNSSYADNTMRVQTDSKTIKTVISSDKPFEQVEKELEQNDINYSSKTLGGKIKLKIFSGLENLAETFGLVF